MASKSKKKSIKKAPAKKAAAKKKPAKKKIVAKKSKPVFSGIIKMSTASSRKPIMAKDVNEKPLTDTQISKFRDVLSQKRDELLDVVQRKKEQEIQVGESEIGDEADIATRSVEKEMLFELTDSEKQTIDMIEAALRRIEKGVYGRCESCRKNILRLRLEVMPWVRYCINCQSEQEIPSQEPVL
jgi:DnaK suppressor protein